MSSQVTLSDGTTTVNVDGYATLDLGSQFVAQDGSTLLRMLNGTGVKQTHWDGEKLKITITAKGWVPPSLETLDYTIPLTLTIPDPATGTKNYTVFASRPTEDYDINGAAIGWSLICEEQ